MTQLKITCDKAKKTLKFTGDKIAVGEHCRIAIEGLGEVGVDNLRLRVLVNDETIARFPLEDQAWNEDLSCELNLNTVQAKEIVQCCAQGLFVLDDTSVPQLYGMGMCHLGPWPQENGEDVPYDLSGYPDNIEALKTEIENFRSRVIAAEDAASAARSSAKISSEQSTLSAKSAAQAASSASQAQVAAERAEAAVSTALKRMFVNTLPTVGSPNIIYLVPSAHPVSGDERDEYMWNDTESKWEKIGSSATTVILDETVTEASENGVKSKGIWSFVKELFGKLATVATSGSYSDLTDKPTIPEAVTEETVSGWGFLKKTWAELVAAFAAKTDIPTDYAKVKNIPSIYVVDAEDMSAFDEAIFEAFVDEYGSTVKRYEGSKLRFVVGDDGTLLCVNKISGKTLTISASDKSFFDYKLTQTTGSYVFTFYAKKLAFLDKSDVVAPASDMALKNKAADAYETGVKLDGKFDKNENFNFQHTEYGGTKYDLLYLGNATNPEAGVVSITKEKQGENGAVFAFRVNDGKGNVTIVTLENTGKSDEKFALVSQLQEKLGKNENAAGLTPSAKAALFADTAFSQKLHYALNNDGTIKDRAVNKLTWTAESESHSFSLDANLPAPVDGVGRDFLVQIHTDAAVDITSALALKGDLPSITEAGDYILAFTELHDNMWLVKKLTLEDAQ